MDEGLWDLNGGGMWNFNKLYIFLKSYLELESWARQTVGNCSILVYIKRISIGTETINLIKKKKNAGQ